ncbi:MAG: hypothetical protein IKG70_02375, partial [Lachnospiraceae bacterium]|nr:hypothetical protein [Lachnospiraceae bacterium]
MNRKRILAWLLALAMIIGMFPTSAFADDEAAVTQETAAVAEASADDFAALPEIEEAADDSIVPDTEAPQQEEAAAVSDQGEAAEEAAVVSDQEEAAEEAAAAEATEPEEENVDKTPAIEAETNDSETAKEEAAETPAVKAGEGAAEESDASVVLEDGTYKANGLSTAVLSMYHFDAETARVVIKGDAAWLITSIDGAKEASTLNRFNGMAYGKQTEILDPSDETNHTLVEGTAVANVIEIYGDDGETVVGRTFVLSVPKSIFEQGSDIYYMIKYRAGYSDTHDGDWYKATGGDYYLTGYTLEKVSDSTELPGEEEQPIEPEIIELTITNNTGMFKAVTATAIENEDGSATLTFALSGTGYKWLYKGTYEEALAANAEIESGIDSATPSAKLLQGILNEDGMLEFTMQIKADELDNVVPVVAISESYYNNYKKGQNTQERAYYPRQFNLDLTEATLITGDYDNTLEFALTSEVADFQAATPVSVHIVGGPNSNNYKVELTLVMDDATYDSVTYPSVVNGAVATATAELADGKFAISMLNAPNKPAFQDKTPLTFMFHVAESAPYEEAGTDVERTVTFDQVARTITVAGEALTPKTAPAYAEGLYILRTKLIGAADNNKYAGQEFSMFKISRGGGSDTKDPIAVVDESGKIMLTIRSSKTTYPWLFLNTRYDANNPAGDFTNATKVGGTEVKADDGTSVHEFSFEVDPAWIGSQIDAAIAKVESPTTANDWSKYTWVITFGELVKYDPAVEETIDAITALPTPADVVVTDEDQIEAARALYDALTDEQKALVTNYDKLVSVEEAFAALEGATEETLALIERINGLPASYLDVTDANTAETAEVRASYDALDAAQKAYVDNYTKLVRAEACIKFLEKYTYNFCDIADLGVQSDYVVGTTAGNGSTFFGVVWIMPCEYNYLVSKTPGESSRALTDADSEDPGKLYQAQVNVGNSQYGYKYSYAFAYRDPNTGVITESDEIITLMLPSTLNALDTGTYSVKAIQDPESKMRKYENVSITSTGKVMTATFTMPNTSYDKIYLGSAEAAAADADGAIPASGTGPSSGSTGEGNIFTIPVASMYRQMYISYHLASKDTWTRELVEFVMPDDVQVVVSAIDDLKLRVYFNVTAEQREAVNAAKVLYDALDENGKALIANSNGDTLLRVVEMFAAADEVTPLLEALPAADEFTADHINQLVAAKLAFDSMGKKCSGNLQNSQVEKLIDQALRDKLDADLLKLATMTADAITVLPEPENVTKNDADAVAAARGLLDKLVHSNDNCSNAWISGFLVRGLTKAEAEIVTEEIQNKLEACEAVLPEKIKVKIDLLGQVKKNTLNKVLFDFEVSAAEGSKLGYEKPDRFKYEVTMMDAAVALHREIYGKAFEENPTAYLKISSAGTCTLIFGEATYMNGFHVNDVCPEYPDKPGIGSLWNDTPLKDGDNVRIFKVNGEDYGIWESYLIFDKGAYTAHEGDSVEVTVTGDLTFGTMMGMDADVTKIEDAVVYAVTDYTDPVNTKVAQAVSDEDGIAEFKNLPAGEYHLVVGEYENDYEEDCFSTPYATLTVSAHEWTETVTPATFEENGSRVSTCSVCGTTTTEVLKKYGFTVTVDGEEVPAEDITIAPNGYDASYADWQTGEKVENFIPLATVKLPA